MINNVWAGHQLTTHRARDTILDSLAASESVRQAMDSLQTCKTLTYLFPTPENTIDSAQVSQALSSVNGYMSNEVISGSNERLIVCIYNISSQEQLIEDIQTTVKSNCGFEVFVQPGIANTSHATLIQVEGMTCNSCVKLIQSTLPTRDGVTGVKVSLVNKEAFVVYDSLKTNAKDISSDIYDMGFDTEIAAQFSSLSEPLQLPEGKSRLHYYIIVTM